MTTVKEINHDSSTVLSDFYSSITDPNGAVSVTVASALLSSTNGVEIDFDAGAGSPLLRETFTALSGNDLRWRFVINLANCSNSSSVSQMVSFELRTPTTPVTPDRIAVVQLEGDGGSGFWLQAFAGDDNDTLVQYVTDHSIASSGEVCIEVRAVRATSSIANDGECELFVNTVSIGSTSAIDNYDAWAESGGLNECFISILSTDPNITGILYYDEWILDDDSTTALCSATTGSYIIGTAIDNETAGDTAWLTLWRDSAMYLQRWDLPTMTKEFEISLGAATLAQVQARSRVAYPFAGSDQTMWVFGNMASPAFLTGTTVHLMETTGAGASGTWANASVSLGSWASDDVLDSLFVSTDQDGLGTRLFTAVRRQAGAAPELWQGLGGLSFVSTIPLPTGSSVEYRGMHVGRNTEISVGSATLATGTSRIFSAISPYTTWTDKTFDFPSGTVEVLRYL